ncbi:uncharacterized protein V6R79_007711 [Siganus canaliculatus]
MATLDAADSPGELAHMLNKAYKKIANILEDIDRMSSVLQRKDSVLITLRSRFPTLTNWLETSRTGEAALQNNTSALGQTVLWDPSSSCQRPACSTPNRGTPWTEVVIRGRKRAPSGAHGGAPSPLLPLTNKYAALSEKPATRDLHQQTSPVPAATVCLASTPGSPLPAAPTTSASSTTLTFSGRDDTSLDQTGSISTGQVPACSQLNMGAAMANQKPAEEQDDLHYASVSLQEEPLYLNVRPAQRNRHQREEEEEEDGVEYTAVTFQSASKGPPESQSREVSEETDVLYSAVYKKTMD